MANQNSHANLINHGLYRVSSTSAVVPSSLYQGRVVYVQLQPQTIQLPMHMQFQAPQTWYRPCEAFLKTHVYHVREAPFTNCMWENFTILPETKLQVMLDPLYPLWACVLLRNGKWKWIGRHHL